VKEQRSICARVLEFFGIAMNDDRLLAIGLQPGRGAVEEGDTLLFEPAGVVSKRMGASIQTWFTLFWMLTRTPGIAFKSRVSRERSWSMRRISSCTAGLVVTACWPVPSLLEVTEGFWRIVSTIMRRYWRASVLWDHSSRRS